MELVIRKAAPGDAGAVAEIHAEAWRAAYRGIVPAAYLAKLDAGKRAERFRREFAAGGRPAAGPTEFFVCEAGGRPVGLLFLSPGRDEGFGDAGEIDAIYFLPEFWGEGLGTQAVDFALRRFRRQGYARAVLWVLEENRRARAFYEKCGFVPEGARRTLDFGSPVAELRYVCARALPSSPPAK